MQASSTLQFYWTRFHLHCHFCTAKNILIHVEGGLVVDVYGMPDGWTYEVVDMDVFDGGDEEDQERLGFKQLALEEKK